VPDYPMGSSSTAIYAQPLYIQNGPGGVPVFVVASSINVLARLMFDPASPTADG